MPDVLRGGSINPFEPEVSKEEHRLGSNLLGTGLDPRNIIVQARRARHRRTSRPEGGSHDLRNADMGDEQPPKIPR